MRSKARIEGKRDAPSSSYHVDVKTLLRGKGAEVGFAIGVTDLELVV